MTPFEITINTALTTPAYRSQLNELLEEAFGFSFDAWFTSWGWPADYTCFSIVENERVLANASLYRMKLLINGAAQEWYQLGAVATRRDHRGEGLSRRLLEAIFLHHSGKQFFLCANDSVLDFYPRFGFRRVPSWQPVAVVHDIPRGIGQEHGALQKMALEDPRVKTYLTQSNHRSQIIDCTNAAPIHWFSLMMEYSDCIYEIPACKTMIVARQEGKLLNLAGVWTVNPVTFRDLAPALEFSGVEVICFGFQPDWMEVDIQMAERRDDPLFIRGNWPVEQKMILPELIRT